MQAHGIVMTVVFGIIILAGTAAIVYKRKHPFSVCRDPYLLTIQNLGSFASCTGLTIYIAVKPNFSCNWYNTLNSFVYCFVMYPMAVRIWSYCVQFHIALLRTKYRANTHLDKGWEQKYWFGRNKWAGSPVFLRRFYLCTFWLWLLPIIPQIVLVDPYDYQKYDKCTVFNGSIFMSSGIIAFYLLCALFAAILCWGARDAYKIKNELRALVLVCIVIFSVWIPYTFISAPIIKPIPTNFWLVLGVYCVFAINTIYPLYLVFHVRKMEFARGAAGYQAFIYELEFLPFRNTFFAFLTTQFCQENILFYEAVVEWKRMEGNDPNRSEQAQHILEIFIEDSGLCQVNIDSGTRNEIENNFNKNVEELPGNMFDEALATVLGHMHTNSYIYFKKQANLIV